MLWHNAPKLTIHIEKKSSCYMLLAKQWKEQHVFLRSCKTCPEKQKVSESLKGYEFYLCTSLLLKIKSEVPQEDFIVVEEEIGCVVPTALLESQAKSRPLSLVLLQLLLHCVVKLFLFNILGCLCS